MAEKSLRANLELLPINRIDIAPHISPPRLLPLKTWKKTKRGITRNGNLQQRAREIA